MKSNTMDFLQQLEPLAVELVAGVLGEPGDVPARSRQSGDEPGTDRINAVTHDNRDRRGRLHSSNRIRSVSCRDDVHTEPDQFYSKRGHPFRLAVGEGAELGDTME